MSSASDILRPYAPVEPGKWLNLYLGSGRCGAAFNAAGLMDRSSPPGHRRTSQSVLLHADHWHEGTHQLQHHVPLLRLCWGTDPLNGVTSYHQRLHLASGRLVTSATTPAASWSLTVGFSPAEADRDVLACEITWQGNLSDWEVLPISEWGTAHGEALTGSLAVEGTTPTHAALTARTGSANSAVRLAVSGDATFSTASPNTPLRLRFQPGSGRARFLLASGSPARTAELDAALARLLPSRLWPAFASAWKTRLGSARIRLSDTRLQKLHDRAHFFCLASYAPEARCPAPPMGWTGNSWGYHFPQDLSYVAPALLRLGHTDIVKSWIEFYASREAQMREMTRRIYRAKGVMWAWEFPLSPTAAALTTGAPNHYQYEIHNAAYPARMAWETALALGDKAWSRSTAWPVIHAAAEFYASVLKRGRDRLWGLHVTPSSGQDEYGGTDQKNFLCALFSAAYTLRTAVTAATRLKLSPPGFPLWKRILADGLAFPRLLDPAAGLYRTSEQNPFRPGSQKHPVQLNPLTFLPLGAPDAPTRAAYAARHRIVATQRDNMKHPDIQGNYYDGWTLLALALAATRMGDPAGLSHELSMLETSQLTDPEWIQLYESSGYWCPYYTTSMGLFMTTLHDALACTWPGAPRTPSAWPATWGTARFTPPD
jgi:hypothetical protein